MLCVQDLDVVLRGELHSFLITRVYWGQNTTPR